MEKISKYNKSGDEITRYGFISNMESFIEKLMSGKIDSQTSSYLQSHGITANVALKHLLAKKDKNNPQSSILSRKESIKSDKESKKDKFCIKYTINNRKNIDRDLRNLYISIFESVIPNGSMIDEEGEGGFSCGAVSADASGQYTAPLFGKDVVIKKPLRIETVKRGHKTIKITEKQAKLLAEMSTCDAGNYTYDAPAFIDKETADHKNMFAKAFQK